MDPLLSSLQFSGPLLAAATSLAPTVTSAASTVTAAAATAATSVTTSAAAASVSAPSTNAQVMDATSTSLKLASNTNTDAIGNALNDSITGNSGANHLYGMAGNDTLDGGGGADTLSGGAGDDTYFVPNGLAVVLEDANGGNDTVIAKGDYTLSANVENLVLNATSTNSWDGTGNELNNKITGNGGANTLDGMAGNDTIDGGAGGDTVIGGAGEDRLTGGAGVDLFRFGLHSGHDVVTDFGAGGEKDVIDISAYKAAGITATLHDVGADLVINFSSGDSITLQGVHQSNLVATSAGWVF
jgi:serralysin